MCDFKSKYFTFADTTVSASHPTVPNKYQPMSAVATAVQGVANYMDYLRELLGTPVIINSWYRSMPLNLIVGGKTTSQHMKGEAVDFIAPKFGTPAAIVEFLKGSELPFDQLIMEGSWVHISFCTNPNTNRAPRKQVLYLG